MKMKSLALIMAISFVLPLLPISAFAVGRFDTENKADVGYQKDIVYFNELEGNITCSSGGINRWQSISNATKKKTADPKNESNNVFLLQSTGKGYLTKGLFWTDKLDLTDNVVFSYDFYLPGFALGDAETLPLQNESVSFDHGGENYAHFTYLPDDGAYSFSLLGSDVGSIAADTWAHISYCLTPNGDGTTLISIQLSGDGIEGGYVTAEKTSDYSNVNLGKRENSFYIRLASAADATAAVYVDNTKMYRMYDFAPAVVETEVYEGDGFRNFDLEGKITLKLHHELDLGNADLSRLHIRDGMAQNLPFASVSFLPGAKDTIVIDFAGHKLPPFKEIYICFDDTFLDIEGNPMHEPVIKVETKGENGEIPPAKDIVEVPVEGFVMPDLWNTGYRCAKEELVPFEEKYPEFAGKDGYEITESIARKYNYEFSHFVSNKAIYVMTESPVYLHDFLQDGAPIWNGKSGPYATSSSLTIAWMEGCNNRTSNFFNNMTDATLSHCYVHDVMGDHIQAIDNLTIEYCYFRDGGTRAPGAHADIIQFSGNSNFVGQNIKLYGNRFDAPPLLYDHVANSCVFFSPEEERTYGFNDVHIVGNWFNGGGYTTYIAPEDHTNVYGRVNQIYYNYNQLGYGHNFRPVSCSYQDENGQHSLASVNGTYIGNGYVDTLHAGSIVFFSGSGDEAVRVFSLEDLTAGEGKVMVNFANYMTVARGYRIEVFIKDQNGKIIYTQSKNGEIKRYTPVKEYATADNKEPAGVTNPENDSEIYQLINMPDLPHDVYEYVELNNLPKNLEGCSISVQVYDTEGDSDVFIRSSTMTNEISDFVTHKAAAEDRIVEVRFEDINGNLLSTVTLNKGENATAPEAPAREGYAFIGWSQSIQNVRTSMTVRPVYERRYTVTFLDKDGNVLSSQSIGEGKSATPPAPPAYEGYAFVGWPESIQYIQSDLTVTPVYEKVIPPTVAAFMSAVNGISVIRKEDFTARLMALQAAESAYLLVADRDKEDESVKTAYANLLLQVESYNRDVDAVNHTFSQAVCGAMVTLDRGRQLPTLKFFVSLS